MSSTTPSADMSPDTEPARARHTDPFLLERLVCPITKTSLRYDAPSQRLISDAAKLAFPIRDGIPILLISEAARL